GGPIHPGRQPQARYLRPPAQAEAPLGYAPSEGQRPGAGFPTRAFSCAQWITTAKLAAASGCNAARWVRPECGGLRCCSGKPAICFQTARRAETALTATIFKNYGY